MEAIWQDGNAHTALLLRTVAVLSGPGPRGGNLEGRAGARGAAEAEAEEVEEAAVKEAAGSCDPIGPQEEVFFALLDFLRAV